MIQASAHQRDELRKVNEEQRRFYESQAIDRGNLATRVWRGLRGKMHRTRNAIGVGEHVYKLHRQWLGDLSGKKVLDLGCYQGNFLSLSIAETAESYLGVDLSRPAIDRLRAKLEAKGLKHAQARAVDFLDPNFTESGFDVIYAYAVAHHFRYFETFLKILAAKLAPAGIVVTFDPMKTSLPTRMARTAYRPFQSDKDWEWPFTKSTFAEIQKEFEIVAVQGVMGYVKWCLPLSFLSEDLATRTGRSLFARDLREASMIGPSLWRCMQVAMCWRKRTAQPGITHNVAVQN